MAADRKPKPVVEIVFEAEEVRPERIPVSMLSRALAAVQKLALGTEQPRPELLDERSLRLIGVKRGSAVMQCFSAAPAPTLHRLRRAGHLLDAPQEIEELAYAFHPIDELSAIA